MSRSQRVRLTHEALDAVMALEVAVYPFPWSRGNFVDSLVAGHVAWGLFDDDDGRLLAYCVAMRGFEEVHLLNITVAPDARRRGHARRLIGELVELCRQEAATRLWLEVRVSNTEARATYERLGFVADGVRRGYYPAGGGRREDAVVMHLEVAGTAAPSAAEVDVGVPRSEA